MEKTLKSHKNIFKGLSVFLFCVLANLIFGTTKANQPDVIPLKRAAPSNINNAPTRRSSNDNIVNIANTVRLCPFAKELTKRNMKWYVGNSWKGDSESFVKEVGGFVGAQWSGVKYGTVICLYQGKTNADFPIALELVNSILVVEPISSQWSGLIKNRKICKSSNVYDCSFFVKPPENITDIYKQIEYKGVRNTGILDEPRY